ncbi:potassium/proton antiporter [Synergistaceae bacterium OttesenSCG-928-D05]|nr:potassium/proton antiporter [Synergistaceae bacterium OttesenSCG-928-D05]
MITPENGMLLVALLLLFCIAFSRYLSKAGIPTLVFFILAGMFLGSDGMGGIYFDQASIASNVGNFAICYILFAGGMATRWESVRPVLVPGILLATVGVIITAVLVAFFAYFLLNFSMLEGLLLGSVVSCTDAASVFSILRSKDMNLKGTLAPLLELESSSNDPTAYMLTITVISLMTSQGETFFSFVLMLVMQFSIGIALGLGLGWLGVFVMNRIKLNSDGLYPVVAVAIAAVVFSLTQILKGNGLLAIYLAGMVMGNSKMTYKTSIVRFFDGVSWLMQILVFVTLGLLVFPSQLPGIFLPGMVIGLALMFIVRPLAVFPILHFFEYSTKGKLLVSWVGFRGASSIVFATYALSAGLPAGQTIFNIVFFVSLTSVVLQGSTLAPVARWLGQLDTEDHALVARTFTDYEDDLRGALYEMRVVSSSSAVGTVVQDLKFPDDARILVIRRGNNSIMPTGKTKLMEGDVLMVLADKTENLVNLKSQWGFA